MPSFTVRDRGSRVSLFSLPSGKQISLGVDVHQDGSGHAHERYHEAAERERPHVEPDEPSLLASLAAPSDYRSSVSTSSATTERKLPD